MKFDSDYRGFQLLAHPKICASGVIPMQLQNLAVVAEKTLEKRLKSEQGF
jgi:hypothetical protein